MSKQNKIISLTIPLELYEKSLSTLTPEIDTIQKLIRSLIEKNLKELQCQDKIQN